MHILQLIAENYKRLRVVEITPRGRVVPVTGKNGQGKTSVLDAIWTALKGAPAMPEKPVRRGAEKARIRVDLGELVVTRTISGTGTHTLTVENGKGTKLSSPQAVLDELLGVLTFDPLAFIGMKPKEQVELLRKVASIDLDVDALNEQSAEDYDKRTELNRDIARLTTEANAIPVQAGLPDAKIDETPLLNRIKDADAHNLAARNADEAIREARALAGQFHQVMTNAQAAAADAGKRISRLEAELEGARKALGAAQKAAAERQADYDKANAAADTLLPGVYVAVGELTQELRDAQITNRELDKKARRDVLLQDLKAKEAEALQLTRAIADREEKKRAAVAAATMPIDGLAFSEDSRVVFNGIPLDQLGEAEQIRISMSIAMAANPKLRILRIMHGEALDDEGLAAIAELAEKNDYQVWMARVDSSGKVGVFLEDGMVKSDAQ